MSKYIDNATKKLKSIKNKELILAVIICIAIVAVFVYSQFGISQSGSQTSEQYTFQEYNMQLEQRLGKLIGDINGVQSASVAITYSQGVEKIYAYNTQITTSGGVTTETTEIVTVDGQPLVIKELAPTITGVAVVINGTSSQSVRINVIEIVVTLLNIDSSKVQVFAYN